MKQVFQAAIRWNQGGKRFSLCPALFCLAAMVFGFVARPASAQSGKIAFESSKETSNGNIYVMNADGTNQTNLTPGAIVARHPSFSSDGSIAVYEGRSNSLEALILMNADGSGSRVLISGYQNYRSPAMSFDGTHVAFAVGTSGGQKDIYIINTDGTGIKQLTSTTDDDNTPSFSPDGKIIFSRFGSTQSIFTINSDGTGETSLNVVGINPAYSFDGTRIVFDIYQNIWAMKADGTGLTQITFTGSDYDPCFSPDGAYIAFSRYLPNNTRSVFVMKADGSEAHDVSPEIRPMYNPAPHWVNGSVNFPPEARVSDARVVEPTAGTNTLTFLVTLSTRTQSDTTIQYSTADESATAGSDYIAASGTLVIPAGQASGTINVTVKGDSKIEGLERLVLKLTNPVNARLINTQSLGVIADNDGGVGSRGGKIAYVVHIDIWVANADGSNARQLTTGIRAFHPAFNFDGSRLAFNDDNNINIMNADGSNITMLAPGSEPSFSPDGKQIVFVNNNGLFTMNADGSNVVNLNVSGKQPFWGAGGLITFVSADDIYTVNADGTGVRRLTTSAHEDEPTFSPDGSRIVWSTDNLSVMNADGSNAHPLLTLSREYADDPDFSPNGSEIVFDKSNLFSATVSELYVIGADGRGMISLGIRGERNLDPTWAPGEVLDLNIADSAISEGNDGPHSVNFVVTLSAPATKTVTVNYTTARGTAISPDDYAGVTGTLTFAPGEVRKVISVSIAGDTVYEADEKFSIVLSSPANAFLAKGTATITLRNDDPLPSLRVSDAQITEGNSGSVTLNFDVTLSNASASNIDFNYATADGTAKASSDYVAKSGTLRFAPGRLTQRISVTVKGDLLNEPNEVFYLNLSNAIGAKIADNRGVGTIINDDASG